MKLDKNSHLIDSAIQLPAGNLLIGGKDMSIRRLLVIHYTEGGAARTSVGWWNQPGNRKNDLGAHFIIERDGTLYQCRACDRTISHAGTSRWVDPHTGKAYGNANAYSIGIELANTGDECNHIKGEEQLRGYAGSVRLAHRNEPGMKNWERFSPEQLATCTALAQVLVAAYNLDDITGHDCIAPERKIDPGPAFPMEALRLACGFKGLPVVHRL